MNTTFFNFELFQIADKLEYAKIAYGNPKAAYLILLQSGEHWDEQIKPFLEKVLKAIQIQLDQDTVFINLSPDQQLNISSVKRHFAPKKILIFGIPPKTLGIQFPMPAYQVIEHQNCQFLWADNIEVIYEERQNGGKAMSAQLWKSLQQL